MKLLPSFFVSILLVVLPVRAQVNTGSTGADGALDFSGISYATNVVIDMHDHPTGIYNYTSVNIPSGVTVSFIPNANNTPVVWLVQGNIVINGALDVSGQHGAGSVGGRGGPGGFRGGNAGDPATGGQGPGGGLPGNQSFWGGHASFGATGAQNGVATPGQIYGNKFLLPLIGGSGGGGWGTGGGGGGGALLIAAAGTVTISGAGEVGSNGGNPGGNGGGGGSGGAIRIIASKVAGNGRIITYGGWWNSSAGRGRVRLDTLDDQFVGEIGGVSSQGFQPIIIPTAGETAELKVISVGGISVSQSPTAALATPDAIIAAQQNNPIPVVVQCSNVPLNSQITITVKPANGAAVSATGANSSGTVASSTATISINIPRGGGLIYATATTAP